MGGVGVGHGPKPPLTPPIHVARVLKFRASIAPNRFPNVRQQTVGPRICGTNRKFYLSEWFSDSWLSIGDQLTGCR